MSRWSPLTNKKSTPRFLRYKQLPFEDKKKLRALCVAHTQAGACKLLGIGRETMLEALEGTLGDATFIRVQKSIRDAPAPEEVEQSRGPAVVVSDPNPTSVLTACEPKPPSRRTG